MWAMAVSHVSPKSSNPGAGATSGSGAQRGGPASGTPLRVLLLEDDPADVAFIRGALSGLAALELVHVEHREVLEQELDPLPDLILTDYFLRGWKAPEVLQALRDRRIDCPVIVVSGSIGDEAAAECIKCGAADYVSKERFALLPKTIGNVLETFRLRRSERAALDELRRSHALLRMASCIGRFGAWSVDLPEGIVTWSDEVRRIHEVPPSFTPTLDAAIDFYTPDSRPLIRAAFEECASRGTSFDLELELVTARGRHTWVRAVGEPERDRQGAVRRVQGAFQDISGQKRAELAAREIADRLTVTLESITDAFFTVDREWRVTYVNREAERLLRRPREELLGRKLWDEFPEARGSVFHQQYTRAMDANVSVSFEEYYAPLDLWVHVRTYPSPQGLAVYFRDSTQDRRVADALRESEERFRLLIEGVTDYAIFLLDGAGAVASWNQGAERIFGYAAIDAIGSSHVGLFPFDTGTAAGPNALLAQAHATGTAKTEGWCQRKDGSRFWGSVVVTALRDESGGLRGFSTITRDISERRAAEEKLAQQAALLDQASDAILVHDMKLVVQFWSKGAERLYGWTATQACGAKMDALIYASDEAFQTAMRALLRDGWWSGELEQQTRAGAAIIVHARWTLLRDASGRPESVLVINSDVTEQKRKEAQFYRMQRLESIGTLAGGIAHDLNNLLSPITMSVGLLQQAPLPERDRRLVEAIEFSARRGANLVRQILSFARGLEGEHVALDVRRIISEVQAIIADTFPKNIAMEIDVAPDAGTVTGDSTQLCQVLLNLCVNARDAMPTGGRMRITVREEQIDEQYAAGVRGASAGKFVVISVQDTGCGISRETLNRLFEPFFTTKEAGRGTGLGLATAHGITKAHGGFISVATEVGRGSEFRVHLPAAGNGPSLPPAEVPTHTLPRGDGEWILVVDDEAPIRLTTRQVLEGAGYKVLLAEDGAEAIALLARERDRLGLVITDLMMPVMDGAALVAAVRRLAPNMPIIGATGAAHDNERQRFKAAGVDRLLPKPFPAPVLLIAIRELIQRSLGKPEGARSDGAGPR